MGQCAEDRLRTFQLTTREHEGFHIFCTTMNANKPDSMDDGKPEAESRVARGYRLKHVPELWNRGRGFTDARGVNYAVAPDGSLRRLIKKNSKKRRRTEAATKEVTNGVMTPVTQTIIDEQKGNCLPACIASITGISLEEVPHYLERDIWYSQYRQWLRGRGWIFRAASCAPESGYYIAIYPSSVFEGRTHAVVAKDGQVIHDPNPRSKVEGQPKGFIWIEKKQEPSNRAS